MPILLIGKLCSYLGVVVSTSVVHLCGFYNFSGFVLKLDRGLLGALLRICVSFICLVGVGCFPVSGMKLGGGLLSALLHRSRCRNPIGPGAEGPAIPLQRFRRSRCGSPGDPIAEVPTIPLWKFRRSCYGGSGNPVAGVPTWISLLLMFVVSAMWVPW